MLSKKVVIGGILVLLGLMFMFPDASGIVNFCYPASLDQIDSPFPTYLQGCNMWVRENPTYSIFIPLMAAGCLFLLLGLKDRYPTSLKKEI